MVMLQDPIDKKKININLDGGLLSSCIKALPEQMATFHANLETSYGGVVTSYGISSCQLPKP